MDAVVGKMDVDMIQGEVLKVVRQLTKIRHRVAYLSQQTTKTISYAMSQAGPEDEDSEGTQGFGVHGHLDEAVEAFDQVLEHLVDAAREGLGPSDVARKVPGVPISVTAP